MAELSSARLSFALALLKENALYRVLDWHSLPQLARQMWPLSRKPDMPPRSLRRAVAVERRGVNLWAHFGSGFILEDDRRPAVIQFQPRHGADAGWCEDKRAIAISTGSP